MQGIKTSLLAKHHGAGMEVKAILSSMVLDHIQASGDQCCVLLADNEPCHWYTVASFVSAGNAIHSESVGRQT